MPTARPPPLRRPPSVFRRSLKKSQSGLACLRYGRSVRFAGFSSRDERRGLVAQDALARAAEVVSRVRLMELAREYKAYKTELLAACAQVLDRMQLLGGDELKGFEREMAAYLGVAH